MMTQAAERAKGDGGKAIYSPKTGSASAKPLMAVDRLLLCTDFSASSNAALQAAVRIWRHTRAKVTVLHVCEYGPIPATTDEAIRNIERLYAEQEAKLRAIVRELTALGVEADGVVLDGSAPGVILEQIRWSHPDLVVIGTRATRGLERFVFGSTAEAVFRESTCPVLTVGNTVNGIDSETETGPIVVATDFQEGAGESFRTAAAIANSSNTTLHCLHVLPSGPPNVDPAVETIMTGAMQRLTEHGAICINPAVYKVVYGSDVSHAIVDYAKQQGAQAIVLSVRQKSRVASHLPPQRVYRILMTASCPVLTISQKRHASATS